MFELKENYIISVDEILDKIAIDRRECVEYSSLEVKDILITFTYIGGLSIHIYKNKTYEVYMHINKINDTNLSQLAHNLVNMVCFLYRGFNENSIRI